MIYLQGRGSIIIASSPEILCRTDKHRQVVNRPLAGTRMRGANEEEDKALEIDLLADEKERAEHVMLVDLGRNDVGRVSKAGIPSTPELYICGELCDDHLYTMRCIHGKFEHTMRSMTWLSSVYARHTIWWMAWRAPGGDPSRG